MLSTPPLETAGHWLAAFESALAGHDAAALAALFRPDSHWRDLLTTAPDFTTTSTAEAIAARLLETRASTNPHGFRLTRTPPRRVMRAGETVIEAIAAYTTATGTADAVLRLRPGPHGPQCWTLMTSLDRLHAPAPSPDPHTTRDFAGENWLDRRLRARAYADRSPTALVIGAGQAGLAIAARLGAQGIDTLVIDRIARIGDNWRKRYHSLTLHNETHVNHFPYMPFPSTWPTYIPKDKLANWFEAYAEAMELNVWTSTELTGGTYDEATATWTVTLTNTETGARRMLTPRHLVFATGVSTIPLRPKLPGLESFAGTTLHSGEFLSGAAWRGKRALVLGTGTSGHDVAQDLASHGCHTTIIQRSKTYVVSLKEAQAVYALYNEGPPTEDNDLLATASPYPVLKRAYQLSTAKSAEADKPLIEGLIARGFQFHLGEDATGFQMMYLRRGGGYYFNVGASEMIIDGRIGLLPYADIETFTPEGARLRDGSLVPADLIVLATGYADQREVVRRSLGDAIAERIGPVWGFGEDGELRNMWRPTPQPGLWFTAGSLAQSRIYSKFLALQIAMRERH